MNYLYTFIKFVSSYSLDPGALIGSLLITAALYSLPIIIYRYAVHREPVSPKKGKTITIAYGIAAWIIMSVIKLSAGTGAAGGAILVWSYVNYAILTKGWVQHRDTVTARHEREDNASFDSTYHSENEKDDQIIESEVPIANENKPPVPDERKIKKSKRPKYCDLCGNKLNEDDKFCDSCGTRITDILQE